MAAAGEDENDMCTRRHLYLPIIVKMHKKN
jgi:hypothetical protein